MKQPERRCWGTPWGADQLVDDEALLEGLDTINIGDVPMFARTYNAVRKDNCETFGDVARRSKAQWLRAPNIGKVGLADLLKALAEAIERVRPEATRIGR
jgi:DNA-directed RNA polymerase alpha subunit